MAAIQEQKTFIGKMDKDSSPESVSRFDYTDAHNIRNLGKEGGDENYLINIEGNLPISHPLPMGLNKAIGTQRFETVGKAYTIIYNSQGFHRIEEFDYDSEARTIVFENLTDSNGIDVFPINPNSYFSDIRLMHERFLIFNNSTSSIFCINIETFKESRGTVVVQADDLLLIKKPNLIPPTFEYANDSARTANALRGELFQFITQFEYEDFRGSSWSTVSKRIVPINEPANGQGQNVSLLNVLIVKINIGDDRVERINIGLRTGNNNWLLLKTVDRDAIVQLPDTEITIGTNIEAYNPTTNEYIFTFYNDGLYPVLDQVEVGSLYDHVPQSAETIEIINGNILGIGGLTEGYARPIITSEDLSVTSSGYAPNISSTISGGTDFDLDKVGISNVSGFRTRVYFFKGTPKEGDVITFRFKATGSIIWSSYSYTVTASDEFGGMTVTLNSAATFFRPNFSGMSVVTRENRPVITSILFGDENSTFNIEFFVVRQDIGALSTQSINTLKSNSSYQTALAYYDKFGRAFPIVTDTRFVIKTTSLAESEGNLTQINWNLPIEAPEGAASYQWLLSENQTHLSSIKLTGKYSSTESSINYLTFEMKSLERFYNNEKDSQVTYSFTKGDKVTFEFMTNGQNATPTKRFRFPFIDLDIVDFTIEENPAVAGDIKYILKVRSTDILKGGTANNFDYLTDQEILMELYTPKKRAIADESLFFYEIGEQFPIIDGEHSVTSGTIREGDWYFRGRLYESTVTDNVPINYLIEDPNFSDNYESKYYSFGRPRLYNDEVGKVFKRASIRYSDEYIYGSKYNGISRFYLERIYGEIGGQTTSKYGAIKRLEMRDNGLVAIQEFKVGVIPVYKAIIFDNTDTSLVADSGKIFGSIQYRIGNYGCGDAKESITVSRDGTIYFIDDNNCLPIRDTYNGIQVIDTNLHREFINYVKRAKDRNQKIIGVFDDNFQEYNVTISDNSNTLVVINFNSGNIDFENTNFNVLPSGITIESVTNGTYNYNSTTGAITFTPTTDFVGIGSITWSFEQNGEAFTRTEFFNVVAGNAVPETFTFTPLVNQQISTLLESNVISVGGINMPSPISIESNGQYQINDSPWTSTSGFVNSGDLVRVRTTSSASKQTTTSTTLTIGGVSGTFSVSTIPNSVPVDQYVDITGYVFIEEVGVWGIRIETSHTMPIIYSISAEVIYNKFGSNQATAPIDTTISVNSDDGETSGVLINPTFVLQGTLLKSTSSPYTDGTVVVCSDSVSRILRINQSMFIDPH